MLALLSLAQVFAFGVWFSASALAPQLREAWHLTASQSGWLTTIVQLGFVAGTAVAAVLNLADILPISRYYAVSACAAALCNAGLILVHDFVPALGLRFLTGVFLAGVYPPAMKMISTWYKDGRGFAIGTIVGALTVGKASPYLVHSFFENAEINVVVLVASFSTAMAGLIVFATYHDGPFAFERRPFSWGLVGSVWKNRGVRLAIGGYLGHMWELYAMWTWIATFLVAGAGFGQRSADLGGFAIIAIGSLGCVLGGWAADRIGRERLTIQSMAVSGFCASVIGLFTASREVVLIVALIWGFAIVADSAQFSALVTELSPPHAVGTALTLQTSMGFLLTMASIQLVPRMVEATGWRLAFVMLAAGPALGILAMQQLLKTRARSGS